MRRLIREALACEMPRTPGRSGAGWLGRCLAFLALLGLNAALAQAQDGLVSPSARQSTISTGKPKPVQRNVGARFTVRMAAAVTPAPFPKAVQVYIMLKPATRGVGDSEPRQGPDWFNPAPLVSQWARDWSPQVPLWAPDPAAQLQSFPGPLTTLPPGAYRAQAVVRLNPHTHKIGDGDGNAYSAVASLTLTPEGEVPVVELLVDRLVTERPLRQSERIRLVEVPSPLLTQAGKHPARHRAAVILPPGPLTAQTKLPTLYIVPGFGGDHTMAPMYLTRQFGYAQDFVRVVLDPDCGLGHHVFADSPANGPRGQALVAELIPYLEANFPIRREPATRFLNGHSSGGWSVLWLKIQHPGAFGAVWSTSPDPVDFQDFTGINLYEPGVNLYRTPQQERRPLARQGLTPVLFVETFAQMERALGDGGQLRSFEAVFSPLGRDGKPMPLYDRATGVVDPAVVAAWKRYDIHQVLKDRWSRIGPNLRGKLHIVVGSRDTFYLEGAVQRLRPTLQALDAQADVVFVPNRDHFDLLSPELAATFDQQMHEELQRIDAR